MPRLTRALSLAALVGASMSSIAAAVPPVFDWVPSDSALIIGVNSLGKADQNFQALVTSSGMPLPPMATLDGLLNQAGLKEAIVRDKAVAIFIPEVKEPMPENTELALIPISSFDKLVEGLGGKVGDAVVEIHPGGGQAFVRNLGNGYAVLGHSKETVEAFAAKPGSLDAIKKAIGKAGDSVAESSDVFVVVDAQKVRPFVEARMAEMKQEMEAQMGMMGEGAAGVESSMKMVQSFMDAMLKDGRVLVAGTATGETGVGVNASMTFAEGSEMGKAFAAKSDSGALLKNLPAQPYVFAFAMDLSNPIIKDWMKTAAASQGKAMGGGMPSIIQANMERITGQAMCLGANPMMLMGGGVFTNAVTYMQTQDPAACVDAIKTTMTEMSGKTVQGMSYTASFKPDETKVGDVSVDGYEMKITADESNMMASQVMAGLFGPAGGPAGYIAKTGSGVIQTMSKNTVLLQAALDAPNKDNMSKDASIAGVAARMPSNRIVEVYVGAKSILEMIVPMAGMMGAQVNVTIPPTMPPIAFGIGSSDGAAHIGFFMPVEVLKAGAEFGKAFQGMGAGPGGGDAPAEPTGQPRF